MILFHLITSLLGERNKSSKSYILSSCLISLTSRPLIMSRILKLLELFENGSSVSRFASRKIFNFFRISQHLLENLPFQNSFPRFWRRKFEVFCPFTPDFLFGSPWGQGFLNSFPSLMFLGKFGIIIRSWIFLNIVFLELCIHGKKYRFLSIVNHSV